MHCGERACERSSRHRVGRSNTWTREESGGKNQESFFIQHFNASDVPGHLMCLGTVLAGGRDQRRKGALGRRFPG